MTRGLAVNALLTLFVGSALSLSVGRTVVGTGNVRIVALPIADAPIVLDSAWGVTAPPNRGFQRDQQAIKERQRVHGVGILVPFGTPTTRLYDSGTATFSGS